VTRSGLNFSERGRLSRHYSSEKRISQRLWGGRFRAAKFRVDDHPDPVFTPAFALCRGYRLNAP
jgi:hypothetical protein